MSSRYLYCIVDNQDPVRQWYCDCDNMVLWCEPLLAEDKRHIRKLLIENPNLTLIRYRPDETFDGQEIW